MSDAGASVPPVGGRVGGPVGGPVGGHSQPAAEVALPGPQEEFLDATTAMRETAKWLLAVFAGLGSLLVAGVAIGDVAQQVGRASFVPAIVGLFVGLLAVGGLIVLTSRVLTARVVTWGQLLRLGRSAPGEPASAEGTIVYEINSAGFLELYGPHDFADLLGAVRGDPGQRAAAQHWSFEPEVLAEATVAFATYVETRRRFRQLQAASVPLVVVAVAAFATMGILLEGGTPAEPVRSPYPVTVTLSGDGQDRLRAATGCPAATFDGWAVGGTLEHPVVAAHPPGCGAFRLDLGGDDGVALPTGAPTPAPASTASTASTTGP